MLASKIRALLIGSCLALVGGCTALTPDAPLTTATVPPTAERKPELIVHGTKVVADAPTRVFVIAGLDSKCRATKQPAVVLTQPPTKGTVTLQPVPPTVMQFSLSGKCIGQRVPGIGVYYQARAGEAGGDTFSFAVKIGRAEPITKTIPVAIAN
jgi:hypothetical protein